LTQQRHSKTIAVSLRSRRGLIRLGAAAAAAALIALALPGTAAPQFGNITVDTTADGNDGECAQDCTLREAIALADSSAGQWVSVPPGVYRVTLGPITLGNDTVFGVSFAGSFSSGARSTIIDARGASRVFDIPAGATATLAGLTVTGGNAPTGGGAFVAPEGNLSLIDVIMRGNVAADRGGAIHAQGGLGVTNSTFSGNRAANGGAIASDANTQATIFQSTLSGNTASGVGGAIAAANTAALQRVTIAGNTAAAGGGLYLETETASSLLGSVLFARNSSACGGFTSQRFPWTGNLSDDASCAFEAGQGTVVADARIGSLTNNGGPTDTHALLAGSPAINAADQSICPAGSSDQRHAPAPDACDIGAFEFGARPPQTPLPPPVAGETVNVSESRGRVRVRLPGSDEYFELEDAQQVPVGSTFDTSKGRVNLVAAGQQRSWFYKGVFKLGQSRGAKPLSTLTLTGRLACGKSANAAAKKKRRLWGDGKGKFRTKGKHSAATVVGTRWVVEDRCNGTLTRVLKGRVRVRDFRARRTVVVKAGKRYFARAR
jgi:CSLREA domain-containing protein